MADKVFKSAIWYTAANLLNRAMGFVTIPVFTRLLTKAEFGIYNNYISWIAVMTIVVSLCLEATIISAKRDYADSLEDYVSSMVALSMLSALVWIIVANLFMAQFQLVFLMDSGYINSIFIYLLFIPAITLFQTWERFVYRYKITALLSVGLAVGIAFFAVLLTVCLPNSLDGAIYGRLIPAAGIGVGVLLFFVKRKSHVRVSHWAYALPIALPFIPHVLSMTLLGALNRILVIQLCGAEANALYGLAYNCGLIVTVFVSSLNGAFSPWLGDQLTAKSFDKIAAAVKPYLLLFLLLAISVALLAPEVLWLLGGESYMEAMFVIPPIVMGCIFQFTYSMYVNVEQYERKTGGMAIASVSAVIVNLLLAILLIPRCGYIGAAYASACAYAWLMLAHVFLVFRIGMAHVYENRFVITVTVAACVVVGLASFMYTNAVVRWCLLAAICVLLVLVGYRHRDRLKRFVQKS